MSNQKSLVDELTENKAVQAGGATLAAAGLAEVGVSAAGFGVLSTGGTGLLLAAAGPVGLIVGGILLAGGIISTIDKRTDK